MVRAPKQINETPKNFWYIFLTTHHHYKEFLEGKKMIINPWFFLMRKLWFEIETYNKIRITCNNIIQLYALSVYL